MAELRWILLAIGAAVIVAVWLYGRAAKRPKRRPLDENLIDAVRDDEPPELVDVFDDGLTADEIEALGRSLQREVRDDDEELILTLHVARERPIAGAELYAAMLEEGLGFGRMDIYHADDDAFSVANMVEPGTFDPVNPDAFSTPGVTLFAVLPGPVTAGPTLERMLSCAKGLADALGASVLDETRSVLTRQTESHLRERVVEFEARRLRG